MLSTEKLNALTEPTRDAARLLAETALDGSEKILTLSMDAVQDAIDAGSAQVRETWADFAQVDPMAWPTLVAGSFWRSNALNRSWLDIGSRLQREMSGTLGTQMQAFQDSAADAFGAYSRLVSDLAVSAEPDRQQEVVEVRRRRAA